MKTRFALIYPILAVIFVLAAGCEKRDLTNQVPRPTSAAVTLSPDTIVRIRWTGRKHLDLDVNGYTTSRIWSLPETKLLQQQTSDKLATNILRGVLGDDAAQIPPSVFRPLFDDIVLEESYFELRSNTNSQPPEWCFAIHANERRAGSWETNLVVFAEMLTGGAATTEPAVHGWTVQGARSTSRAIISHIGDWIVVGFGSRKNQLFEELADRIMHQGAPATSTNWLDVYVDLNRAARVFSFSTKTNVELPRVQLAVTGDGSHVITDGRLMFSNALPVSAKVWQVPTNLIHEPLLSFTSVRGVESVIASSQLWKDLHIGAAPDQLFFWSLSGNAYETYLAAPSANAGQEISALTDFLLQRGNPWLAKNGYINFHRASDSNGVVWGDVSSITPFIRAAGEGNDHWLYGGLLLAPNSKTNVPSTAPIDFVQQTNLVYYDWELTGQLLPARLALLQTARQIGRAPQMATDCDSLNWLGVLIPRLGPCETTVKQTGPNQLAFHRKSTIGLTAIELHLLADWLESSRFPRGFHSVP